MWTEKLLPERYLHLFFLIGVYLKAFDGVVEILAGIALFFPARVIHFLHALLQTRLINSIGFIAHHKQAIITAITNHAGVFITIYILSHGVIKLFLVVGLLKRKLWAYPAAIVVFIAFIIYQIYRYIFTPSFFLIFLTILDLIVIGLTWHEYTFLKTHDKIV